MRQRKYCATAGVLPLVSLLFLPLGFMPTVPSC
jgi:hypothetical protein